MRSNTVQTCLNSLCCRRNELELLLPLPPLPKAGIMEVHQWASMQCWGSRPPPHACEASSLPSALYPQLFVGNSTRSHCSKDPLETDETCRRWFLYERGTGDGLEILANQQSVAILAEDNFQKWDE